MSTQWFRKVRLVLGTAGQGIDVSNLRIVFEVVKTVEAIPNTATIRVYNLNNDHVSAIKDDYVDVLLEAGYGGTEGKRSESISQIFVGNIQFVSHYRDGTDYITEITAGDGDRFYRNAYVSVPLVAGTNDKDAVNAVLRAGQALFSNPNPQTEQVALQQLRVVAKSGIQAQSANVRAAVVQVLTTARSRGKVLSGPARDILTQIARSNSANWSIQDGQLHMVRTDSRLDREAIVLDSTTGLLEAPERNDKGVAAKCLLNPKLEINGAIKLDNSSIRVKQPKQKALKTSRQQTIPPAQPVREDPNGIYKVIKLTHSGDTRSNDWFTTVECLSLAQPIAAPVTARSGSNAKGTPQDGKIAAGLGITNLADVVAGIK